MRSRFYITNGCGDLEVWLREFLGGEGALQYEGMGSRADNMYPIVMGVPIISIHGAANNRCSGATWKIETTGLKSVVTAVAASTVAFEVGRHERQQVELVGAYPVRSATTRDTDLESRGSV